MMDYFHARYPGCLVHSEDATRTLAGHPEDDKARRQVARTDVDSRMYPSPKEIKERYLNDKENPRPFYLCEYSHAMGNGPGDLADYWELIWNNDAFWGGCVWEFTDHSIAVGDDRENDPHYLYGGDFGEFPTMGCFCVDGLVYPDRRPHTGLLELKQAIKPFFVTNYDEKTGSFILCNRRSFCDLSDLNFTYTLSKDGKPVAKGQLSSPAILPGESMTITPDVVWPSMGEGLYTFTIVATQASDTLWAQAGHEIGFEQCTFDTRSRTPLNASGEVKVEENRTDIVLTASDVTVVIDRVHGLPVSMKREGRERLSSPITPAIWRAPTDNDRYVQREWQKALYHLAQTHCYDCVVVPSEDGVATVRAHLCIGAPSHLPILHLTANYTLYPDGSLALDYEANVREGLPPLPRFGLQMMLPEGFENLAYYGRGPVESYRDKRLASYEGEFACAVSDHFEHYVRPQENMAHADTVWMRVSDGDVALLALDADTRFSFNCSHFTPHDLYATAHDFELKPRKETVINLDLTQTGIGSNSCGPALAERHRLADKHLRFAVRLLPVTGEKICPYDEANQQYWMKKDEK
jgi:beta-galactosidase